MSIVAFWNDDKEQTGKTLTSVAVATRMAIERNLKVLLISTSYREPTVKNCFWVDIVRKDTKLFNTGNNIAVQSGIEGLSRLVKANKIQPSIITDYTKVIFKNRLEVLSGYIGNKDNSEEESRNDYEKVAQSYPELLKLANQYYDMVLVDVDNDLPLEVRKTIIGEANLQIFVMTQRLASLDRYNELKNKNKDMIGPKCIPVIGKYNAKSKYNKKNITRYLDEKKDIHVIPFNTSYFEAAEEVGVTELFLKQRDLKDTTDENYIFMEEVLKLTNTIITRLHELQMKKR